MPLFYIAGVVALFWGVLTERQAAGMGGFGGTRGNWLTKWGGFGVRDENISTTKNSKSTKKFFWVVVRSATNGTYVTNGT
jgi:hypothetical protein